MIRNIVRIIKVKKYVEIEEVITQEKITSISVRPDSNEIDIVVSLLNEKNETVDEESITLTGDNYHLLFSSDQMFGEGKQKGTYREDDLWKMIDIVVGK